MIVYEIAFLISIYES